MNDGQFYQWYDCIGLSCQAIPESIEHDLKVALQKTDSNLSKPPVEVRFSTLVV